MRSFLVTVTTYEPFPREYSGTYTASGAHTAAARAILDARAKSMHVRRITNYSLKIQPL